MFHEAQLIYVELAVHQCELKERPEPGATLFLVALVEIELFVRRPLLNAGQDCSELRPDRTGLW